MEDSDKKQAMTLDPRLYGRIKQLQLLNIYMDFDEIRMVLEADLPVAFQNEMITSINKDRADLWLREKKLVAPFSGLDGLQGRFARRP